MLRLRVEPAEGDPVERSVSESLTVGRGSDCDLVLADRYLSRRHARFTRQGSRWLVEDLGSRNGTLVNGDIISAPREVRQGDIVQLSTSLVTVVQTEGSESLQETSETPSPSGWQPTILRPASELIVDSSVEVEPDASPAELRGYAARLRLLNEVHRALSRPIDLEELLDIILDRVFSELSPEEGAVFLRSTEGRLERAASKTTLEESSQLLDSETLAREVVDKGLAALVLDTDTDQRFGSAESILTSGVRSLVAAPLSDPDGCLGMIVLNSRLHRRQFDEADLELLASLASVAALRIRNLALAEEALERRRLEQEISLARQIQIALLPGRLPEIPGFEVLGKNLPSRTVSGDFFELLERRDRRECVLLVADVSGKGVAAALLTASFEALAAGPIAEGAPAEEICSRVSSLLHQRTQRAKYATAWIGVLEVGSGLLRWCNAGHVPPLVVRSTGEVELLEATGLPVGLLPGASYDGRDTVLQPGDLLAIYTDGVSEAENAVGEEYGRERLEAVCRAHREEGLEALSSALEADLDGFTGGSFAADDRTLVLAYRRHHRAGRSS